MNHKLVLDSSNARNSVHYLPEPVRGQYKFVSFCFTNNIFNVNDSNNKIYLNENGSDLIGTLTNGSYDANELKTHLSTVLNSTMLGTVSIALDSNTNKFTITNSLNYYFTFGSNTTNSARKLLGFNESDGTNASSQTSDVPIDINTYKNLYINITENDHKNIYGENYFHTSLVVNGLGNFGESVRYIDRDNFNQCVNLKNTKSLKITIHDLQYNNIELNSEYSIIFEKM